MLEPIQVQAPNAIHTFGMSGHPEAAFEGHPEAPYALTEALKKAHPSPTEQAATSASDLRLPMMVPAWWPKQNAVPSERYVIDCTGMDLVNHPAPPTALVTKMQQVFADCGLVLLTNTGLPDLAAQKIYCSIIIPRTAEEYKAGANARERTKVANVFDTGAPPKAHLHYHHEMTYTAISTPLIGFLCDKATPGKGATYVSDGVMTTELLLRTELGRKLKEKGVCYIRCLTDRETGGNDDFDDENSVVYNHWQKSFGTDDMEEVAKLSAERGMKIEWGGSNDRFLKTKYYTSAFEYCPNVDRNLLYSSLADDSIWFDTWPGVCKLPTMDSYGDADETMRPLKMTFGDDTELTREELQLFLEVYDMAGVKIDWRKGDCLMLCNRRWAHGRPAYTLEDNEERHLGVVLGELFKRECDRDGKG